MWPCLALPAFPGPAHLPAAASLQARPLEWLKRRHKEACEHVDKKLGPQGLPMLGASAGPLDTCCHRRFLGERAFTGVLWALGAGQLQGIVPGHVQGDPLLSWGLTRCASPSSSDLREHVALGTCSWQRWWYASREWKMGGKCVAVPCACTCTLLFIGF